MIASCESDAPLPSPGTPTPPSFSPPPPPLLSFHTIPDAIVNVKAGGNSVSAGGCNVDQTSSSGNGTKIGVVSLINRAAAQQSSMGITVTVQQDQKLATEQAIANMRKAHPSVNKIILLASTDDNEMRSVVEQVEHIDVVILNAGSVPTTGYPTILKHAATNKNVLILQTRE